MGQAQVVRCFGGDPDGPVGAGREHSVGAAGDLAHAVQILRGHVPVSQPRIAVADDRGHAQRVCGVDRVTLGRATAQDHQRARVRLTRHSP